MTILNKTVTLLGATGKLTSFTIVPQPDGSYVATINGTATDGASFTEQLATTRSYPSNTTVLNNVAAAALLALLQDSGLST